MAKRSSLKVMSEKAEKILEQAENYFYSGKYDEALRIYGVLLKDFPDLKEAKIGAILSDIANENDEEAQALFEYYQVLKKENSEDAEKIIEDMINSFDNTLEKISSFLDDTLFRRDEYVNGISYDDFKELVNQRGSFKRAFEDIMFSTKVIITNKNELLDFLQELVNNGFDEVAMRYIDTVVIAYPGEERIEDIIKKMKDL